nr:hypothetical protein [Candidatus Sigynarchaeum springense]
MRYYLLFDSTHLSPAVPLKALTSQGSRLDVACRMLRACVLGPDGKPSGHSASAWFAGSGTNSPAVAIHVDGRVLDASVAVDRFRSELVLAKHLKEIITAAVRGTGEKLAHGITLRLLDTATDAASAFLESIRLEKQHGGNKVVLLLERGTPVLEGSHPGCLELNSLRDEDVAIIVGDHHGFPARVEEELLSISDHVLAIGVGGPRELRGKTAYLGSHVIMFLHLFNYTFTRPG